MKPHLIQACAPGMTGLQSIDPTVDGRWTDYVNRHPDVTVFHSPEWMTVLKDTYGFVPACHALMKNDRIAGIIPLMGVHSALTGRRGVGLPFSDVVGPLTDDEDVQREILERLASVARARDWRFVEIRCLVKSGSTATIAIHKHHTLALGSDPEKLYQAFKKTQIQQSIQRARRAGVVVELRQDDKAMDDFIRLNALTRRKHGIPPQPDDFFWNLHRRLIANGAGFISRAEYGGRAVAAAVYLGWGGKTLVYKYSASDPDALSVKPNHLAMWEAIQLACAKGYATLDFGRTEADNEGLLFYKRGWGTVEHNLPYVHLGETVRANRMGTGQGAQRLKPLIRKLPIPVLKAIGKIVFPHIA